MDINNLECGDKHFKAYVGPPLQYDFMGATQFRLLCTLGIQANHKLLDFGCGSLRAGRFLIPYLDKGKYYAIEPNKWLIDDGIKNEVGNDLINIKSTSFRYNDDFSIPFKEKFDFIIAQSIFSHTGPEIIKKTLLAFSKSIKNDGLIVVTFIEGENDNEEKGWIYPAVVEYQKKTIVNFADQANLSIKRIPWYHPRQTWYLMAKDKLRLPDSSLDIFLQGAVLFDPRFSESIKRTYTTSEQIQSKEIKHIKAPCSLSIKEKLNIWRTRKIIKNSGIFHKQWYLEEYPDVKKSKIDPIKHYVRYGWYEWRNPSPDFNTYDYIKKNPEIVELQICPLLHYILYG